MQASQNLTQIPPSGKQPNQQPNKQQTIQLWLASATRAIAALLIWKNHLHRLQSQEHITDDDFMAAVQELSEAGVVDWADGNPLGLDRLREAVSHG